MYRQHRRDILTLSSDPVLMAEGLYFAITCTIQTPTTQVTRRITGESGFLAGAREKVLDHITSGKAATTLKAAFKHGDASDYAACLATLTLLPQLGYPKAGFFTQVVYEVGGCIDIHNSRLYNWTPRKLGTLTNRYRDCREYLYEIEKIATPERLWDDWCAYIAHRFKVYEGDGEAVSSLHVEWVKTAIETIQRRRIQLLLAA